MTIHATASFTLREGELETALAAIRTFVGHARSEPGTLRYDSYRSADPVFFFEGFEPEPRISARS